MLYTFYGNNISRVRTEALKKANGLLRDGGELTVVSGENGSIERLKDALGAQSLFRTEDVYLLDTLSDETELFEGLLNLLPELRESPNTFVVIEGKLSAKEAKQFGEYATTSEDFTSSEKKDFALSDALLARDKKTLWILLQEAWRKGQTSEALIGTLFWQLKMLRLAQVTQSAEEAGQKPFVYDKAKRALRNFKEGDVPRLSTALVTLYHEGHSGTRNIDHALEAWVLTV
jgi:DNA polymerase III delta subunit